MAIQFSMVLNNFKALFLLIVLSIIVVRSCSSANSSLSCRHEERDALIRFTKAFHPVLNVSGTSKQDCCDWSWITCDGVTGHVVKLEIRPLFWYIQVPPLTALKLDDSLAQLKFLNHLDLRGLTLEPCSRIPEFIGSMKHLKFLDLSWVGFCGRVPRNLGNLTNLEFLSLGSGLSLDETRWVSRLVALKHLDLSFVNVNEGARNDLMTVLSALPSLSHLDLTDCGLGSVHLLDDIVLNSTFYFSRLQYLDLFGNYLQGKIPRAIQNMTSLTYLDLSYNQFNSSVPSWFGRFANLQVLSLSGNNFDGGEEGARNDLMTVLSALPSLSHLDLGDCGLGSVHLLDDIVLNSTFYFSRLQYLDLSGNYLQGKIPRAIQNMTSLTYLDMSDNHFNSSVPSWFGRFANLQHLDLSGNNFDGGLASLPVTLKVLKLSSNQLSGIIPSSLGRFANLQHLDLSGNNFEGGLASLPVNLKELDLSSNHLSGIIPSSVGQFANLQSLYLSRNNFDGGLASLPVNLEELDLSFNQLSGEIPISLRRLRSLKKLDLRNNHLNGTINIVGQLSSLMYLYLSQNNLSAPIPSDLGRNMTQLRHLYLSDNLITGPIPTSLCDMFLLEAVNLADNILIGSIPNCSRHILSSALWWLDLKNNHLSGTVSENIRQLPSTLVHLDLSNNRIYGDIPLDIGKKLPKLEYLFLNDNLISGQIPPSLLCDMFHLDELNLANNTLTGNIPDCWSGKSSGLAVINLSSNNLTGVIPSSIMNLSELRTVHLNKNNLHGELPQSSLGYLGLLVILDLGENNLSGDVPLWIDESLSYLQILRLRDNKLNGTIPHQLCGLFGLQILDLAGNDLEGEIPACFNFIHGMINDQYPDSLTPVAAVPSPGYWADWSNEKMTEVLKGREMEYTKNLKYVITFDLSRNKLIGSIPEELTLLTKLVCLNLSHNVLSGHIPEKIGSLKLLESLDLSNNRLSGTIPPSISDLSMLSHFNLANNNLNGRIPKGNQLDTVYDSDQSIYDGNPLLCGEPLPKLCPGDKLPSSLPYVPSKHDEDDDQDVLEMPMFYVVVMLGFGTGFWGVVGALMLNKSWRAAYFKFAEEEVIDKVYVFVKVKVAMLKRSRIRTEHA